MPRSPVLQELNFVVIGAQGVGKSTFVRCALDLKRQLISPLNSKKMSLEGDVFLISLFELQLDDVTVTAHTISWPDDVQDTRLSRVDGVLALYDVTEQNTLVRIPALLTSSQVGRPRAMTATQMSMPSKLMQPSKPRLGHNRATSEMAMPPRPSANDSAISKTPGPNRRMPLRDVSSSTPDIKVLSELESVSSPTQVSPDEAEQIERARMNLPGLHDLEDIDSPIRVRANISGPGTPTTIANTFLEAGSDVPDDETLMPEEIDALHRQTVQPDHETRAGGYGFDELVDRLVAQPMSKADSKFIATFLCLYRKFAAPAQLLSAVCSRFEGLNKDGEPLLLRMSAQLRHLAIIAQWVAEYPGDFAHPLTWSQLTAFVKTISDNSLFAAAAGQIDMQLDTISEDDDTQWACSDRKRGRASTLESFCNVPSMQDAVKAMKKDQGDAETTDSEDVSFALANSKRREVAHAKVSSVSSAAPFDSSHTVSSLSTIMNYVEVSRRQAELLAPIPRNLLSKIQWHQFMELSDDDIAREMTRIDWIMYSAMRPRDLIRHVSLAQDQKDKCRSLEHVDRMINQFNHVAFWVASMVVLRDKAKHRAKALEKFMAVAWRLRQLNNYNSLGAVIAGINGTAVHRLTQTRELVPPQAQKDFMRLEILMGTQRSHFAYRLAWENTLSEKIPYLPLHRRDLVSAEEGNKTFINDNHDRVNWKKFEVMGDVVIGIQTSQGTPYPNIQRNAEVQRLILDGKISKDDDELYERSLQVEGPGANETRRMFNWFQR